MHLDITCAGLYICHNTWSELYGVLSSSCSCCCCCCCCRLDKLKGQKFFSTSPQHTHEHYMQVRRAASSSWSAPVVGTNASACRGLTLCFQQLVYCCNKQQRSGRCVVYVLCVSAAYSWPVELVTVGSSSSTLYGCRLHGCVSALRSVACRSQPVRVEPTRCAVHQSTHTSAC
jgi:hypothetical protein